VRLGLFSKILELCQWQETRWIEHEGREIKGGDRKDQTNKSYFEDIENNFISSIV
jgi:hypothetical protein